jgi:PilZ domain
VATDSPSSKQASNGEETKGKGKTNQAVVDYLQAPRKKRKSYVVMAAGPNIDQDTISAVQRFMRTQFSKLAFVVVRSAEDFVKYSVRNIILAIIDDEMLSRVDTLKLVKRIKEQKNDGPMPTLFITKDSSALVKDYQNELRLWHEVDEYFFIPDAPRHALFSKIKSGLDNKYQRRGKRYKTAIPMSFQVLDSGEKKFRGTILDFSIHGALLQVEEGAHFFSPKDQIIIHIPISQFIKGGADVFRLSARVRRVLISGDKAGISWEYLSEDKIATMTALLTAIVDVSLAKTAGATRARILKAQADADLTRSGPKPPA